MRRAILLLIVAALPSSVAAQSSQFGVRGLGFPGRPLSVHALGSAGAFGMFDSESSLNPATIGSLTAVTAVFTGVQDFRSVENPAGSESLREARFPQVVFAGPIRRLPMVLGLSYSNYMTRDFSLATADTLDLRGVPVPVSDTLSARGGINDLRFAAAYRLGERWVFGAGIHVLTGSNRLESRRTFSDTSYRPTRQRSELSYAGAGVSLGVIRNFGANFAVALLARADGQVNVERDSTRVSRTDAPHSFGLGLRWRPTPRLDLGSQVLYRTWSSANSDVLAEGGPGAENTFEVAFGGEYVGDPRRPFRRPLRFGARYATVPFLLTPGVQPTELTVSVGSGVRFAQQRAGIDLSLDHTWRDAGEFSERAFVVSVGVSVRP